MSLQRVSKWANERTINEHERMMDEQTNDERTMEEWYTNGERTNERRTTDGRPNVQTKTIIYGGKSITINIPDTSTSKL